MYFDGPSAAKYRSHTPIQPPWAIALSSGSPSVSHAHKRLHTNKHMTITVATIFESRQLHEGQLHEGQLHEGQLHEGQLHG